MAHAGIRNRGTLIALRLLLGAAEAGFVPSVFVSWQGHRLTNEADIEISFIFQPGIPNITLHSDLGCLRESLLHQAEALC